MNLDKAREIARDEWARVMAPSRPQIFVGTATCGMASGAGQVYNAIEATLDELGIHADLRMTGCLGMCYSEPIVDIIKPGQSRITYHSLDSRSAAELIRDYLSNDNPRPDLAAGAWEEASGQIPLLFEQDFFKPQVRIALANAGVIDPGNFNHYLARSGYLGLEKALSMGPDEVIAEIEKSGLRGRGGAGFPTALKWKFCRRAVGEPKYLICNADEGDPGAFMDRSLLESDPHSVLEGMLIAAYAIGASRGFIYIRAEYPLVVKRLKTALGQLRDYHLIGENILDSGFNFDIEIREGAGAFVCGEETALMASLEGLRGSPRPRPPFPAQAGLWAKPTNINNVETLANVGHIMAHGAEWYAGYGTSKSKGTKTFSLAGNVKRTGLIEVPMGTTLGQIIFDIGGGVAGDRQLKAVQTGGPAGGFLPASRLDLQVDYESLTEAGSIMGSGGMIVLDEDDSILDMARYFLTFIESESCGKCVPCRVGTSRMLSIVDALVKGKGKPEDIDTLARLAETVKTASLCGLGQAAPNPVLTTLRYFRNECESGIRQSIRK